MPSAAAISVHNSAVSTITFVLVDKVSGSEYISIGHYKSKEAELTNTQMQAVAESMSASIGELLIQGRHGFCPTFPKLVEYIVGTFPNAVLYLSE